MQGGRRRLGRQQQTSATAPRAAQQKMPEVIDVTAMRSSRQPRNQRNMQEPPERMRRRNRSPRNKERGAAPRQAVVVNLDGASPSESEGEEEEQPTSTKDSSGRKAMLLKGYRENLHITLSPDKMSRGVMSDSSDSEDELIRLTSPYKHSSTPRVSHPPPESPKSTSSGSLEEDIFDVDYSVCNTVALQNAFKEIKSTEASQYKSPPTFYTHNPDKPAATAVENDDDDDCVIDDGPDDTWNSENPDYQLSASPPLFDIESDRPEEMSTPRRSKRERKRMRRESTETKTNIKVKTFPRGSNNINDSNLNLSNDIFLSDEDEEEVNPEINTLIKWGNSETTFRLPIKKWQKFSSLYRLLAEKYQVSVDRVVLNLGDKIINPDQCPGDIRLTIGDCLEGGIVSEASSKSNQQITTRGATTSEDPDTIYLRVQCSDRKATVTLPIGINEKMIILMHKYAEEKEVDVAKLQFCFEGEVIKANSTPASLDMEGEECIDVYKLR